VVTGTVGGGPILPAMALHAPLQTGDIVVFPVPGGGFGAGQVISTNGDRAVVCALNWHSTSLQPPSARSGPPQ